MRIAFWQRFVAVAALGMGLVSLAPPARAVQFDQQEIDQARFIVLAAPGGELGYKLLILEQIKDSRPCWTETGSSPSNVEPLLLSFDFTGICNRIVDSNGFSVRAAGQDQALQYSLRIIPEENDLVLIAASNTQRDVQVVIGRTNGMPTGFSRIILDSGWRLTRRAFNGRPVGHVYLTYDAPIETVATIRRGGSRRPIVPLPPLGAPSQPTLSPPGSVPNGSAPESIIPVPSLPPGASPSLPPQSPQSSPAEGAPSAAAPTSGSSAPPSLSTILPAPAGGPAGGPASPPVPSTNRLPSQSSRPLPPLPPRQTSGSAATSPTPASPSSTVNPTGSSASGSTPEPSRASSDRSNSAPESTALAQAETYQVVVVADSAELQDKVRAVAPSALLTTINGQVVMQVGVFRDRQDADQLQQRLSREGLPTAVIPVR
jgi:hypothetical protein